jgi:hypothetical protein
MAEEGVTDMAAELEGPACPPCAPHAVAHRMVATDAPMHTRRTTSLKARMRSPSHPHGRSRAERAVRVDASGRGRKAPTTLVVDRLDYPDELALPHLDYGSVQRGWIELGACVEENTVVELDPSLLDKTPGLAVG